MWDWALRWPAGQVTTVSRMWRGEGHAPLTPRLLVAVTRGANAAPAAALEVAIARAYDGETTELLDEEATTASVLDRLGSCGFMHIVSHGLSNPWNAATSEVRLFDEPLSVDHLFTARPGQGRLALLTSCELASLSCPTRRAACRCPCCTPASAA